MCSDCVSGGGRGEAEHEHVQIRAPRGGLSWLVRLEAAKPESGCSESPSLEHLCLCTAWPALRPPPSIRLGDIHLLWSSSKSLWAWNEGLVEHSWDQGSMELNRVGVGREWLRALSIGVCVRNAGMETQPADLSCWRHCMGQTPSFSLQKTQTNPNRNPQFRGS